MRADPPGLSVLRSRPPRFVVMGANRVWNASLMRWLEAVERKTAELVGLPMSFEARVLRIVTPPAQRAAERDIEWRQTVTRRAFVQELILHDYEGVDVGEADAALCRLLLNGYVVYRWRSGGANDADAARPDGAAAEPRPPDAPAWLALGVARNFYPEQRARNAADVLRRWERGQAPTVRRILDAEAEGGGAEPVSDGEVCGLFVAWLAALPAADSVFDAMFHRIAAGEAITAGWLAGRIADREGPADLEKNWDRWILRQKRIVYAPGVATLPVLRQLHDELFVYRMPADEDQAFESLVRLPMEELISRRTEGRIRALAREKKRRLPFLFLGRGEAMDATVEAYIAFFDALSAGARERTLRARLSVARERLDRLEKSVEPEPSDDR